VFPLSPAEPPAGLKNYHATGSTRTAGCPYPPPRFDDSPVDSYTGEWPPPPLRLTKARRPHNEEAQRSTVAGDNLDTTLQPAQARETNRGRGNNGGVESGVVTDDQPDGGAAAANIEPGPLREVPQAPSPPQHARPPTRTLTA
jgi:hypothetical protein